jgi:tetratricopeptide (TPR) repeat protein
VKALIAAWNCSRFSMKYFLLILFSGVTWAQNPLAEAIGRNNEAARLADDGRFAEAEGLYRAALGAKYDDDLLRAKVANNLARLYERQDRYGDAEQMFRKALLWRQKDLPGSSNEVAYSLNNLAEILHIEGRDWEAGNLLETSVQSLQQFHPNDPLLPLILSNLAGIRCQFGRFDEAEVLLRAGLNSYGEQKGAASWEYGITLNNLGRVLQSKNEFEAADRLYAQAVSVFEPLGAQAQPYLATTLSNVGVLYERQKRVEEARQTDERALALLRPTGDEPLHSSILRNLGSLLVNAGHAADSLPYFEKSLTIQEKALGAEHPTTVTVLLEYASAAMQAGEKSLSRKLRVRAKELLARLNRQSPEDLTVSVHALSAAK